MRVFFALRIILLPGFFFTGTCCYGFAISLLSPIEVPPGFPSAYVFRLSILTGVHKNVYGLDLGLIGNVTRERFVGSAFSGLYNYTGSAFIAGAQIAGLSNYNSGDSTIIGLQISGLSNVNRGKGIHVGYQLAGLSCYSPEMVVVGAQACLLYSRAKAVAGLQLGLIVNADYALYIQAGAIAIAKTVIMEQAGGILIAEKVYGAQVGLVSISDRVVGFQFGMYTFAQNFSGMQLGLVN